MTEKVQYTDPYVLVNAIGPMFVIVRLRHLRESLSIRSSSQNCGCRLPISSVAPATIAHLATASVSRPSALSQ
jgi:hypothetical protein